MWATAIKDTKTGKTRLMVEEDRHTQIDLDRFERHVLPCIEIGEQMSFGVHTFSRDCICRPRIQQDDFDYDIVIHEDRKPN